MASIKLTELQREELEHKLFIIRDEPELLESYETTEDEVEALLARVKSGEVTPNEREAEMMTEEVENLIEIAQSNIDSSGDQERRQLAAYIGSMKSLIKKLESAR